MNLPISLYIALRYWRAKSADRFGRLVANLASFGIVLGVMALIIVLSVMNGLEGYQKQQVLSTIPHAIVSQEAPISAEKPLENTPHFVQKAVPINTTNVVFQTAKGVSAGQVIGIQSFSDDPLLEGFDPSQFNQLLPQGEFKLIIGDNLAQKLGLAVGDKVRLAHSVRQRDFLGAARGFVVPFPQGKNQRLDTFALLNVVDIIVAEKRVETDRIVLGIGKINSVLTARAMVD